MYLHTSTKYSIIHWNYRLLWINKVQSKHFKVACLNILNLDN